MAASIRTATKRPLLGLVGRAGVLDSTLPPYDVAAIHALGEAYGVERFLDVHEAILATPPAGDWLDPLRRVSMLGDDGDRLSPPMVERIKTFIDPDGFPLGRFVMDTTLRASLTPHLRHGTVLLKWTEYLGRAREWAKAFFAVTPATAITVGHSDYCPHGFLAEFGLSRGVPALLWTGSDRSAFLVNRLQHGETLIGACRAANAPAFNAHLVEETSSADQDKALSRLITAGHIQVGRVGLAGNVDALESRITDPREALFGGDPRPIVCLFAHTYSDVPCQDDALFRDHQDWLEQTLVSAVADQSYNLLVKVHPLDEAYDVSGLTNALTTAFADQANIAICRKPIENKVLARDCALGVTVRGTPGFVLPALGLRMVLAGRSVFSDVGVAATPTSREAYLDQLRVAGETAPMSPEEIDHAQRFLSFHLLMGSRRHAPIPLMRADGRNSPFFSHASELLKTWIPEDCEVARDLARLWSCGAGFSKGPASIRIGGQIAVPRPAVAEPPSTSEPSVPSKKRGGLVPWLWRETKTPEVEL